MKKFNDGIYDGNKVSSVLQKIECGYQAQGKLFSFLLHMYSFHSLLFKNGQSPRILDKQYLVQQSNVSLEAERYILALKTAHASFLMFSPLLEWKGS